MPAIIKGAEQGYAAAQWRLAEIYMNGEGVPQDYEQAAAWCRKAAEQGHTAAQWCLATMYEEGLGVPMDRVQAHIWINLAVSRMPAGERRERAAYARAKLAAMMTREEIAEAQRLAREWEPTEDGS